MHLAVMRQTILAKCLIKRIKGMTPDSIELPSSVCIFYGGSYKKIAYFYFRFDIQYYCHVGNWDCRKYYNMQKYIIRVFSETVTLNEFKLYLIGIWVTLWESIKTDCSD